MTSVPTSQLPTVLALVGTEYLYWYSVLVPVFIPGARTCNDIFAFFSKNTVEAFKLIVAYIDFVIKIRRNVQVPDQQMNTKIVTSNDPVMMCSSNHIQNDIVMSTVFPVVASSGIMDYSLYVEQRRREISIRIINLNYEGILLLQQRPHNQYQHAAALTKFGQALDLLRNGIDDNIFHQEVQDQEDVAGDNTANMQESASVAATKGVVGSIQSVPICTKDEQVLSEQASPHNAFALYERAFYIDPTNNAYLALSEVDMSVVVMINMAITCHQRGLMKGSQSGMYLQKALGLYKMTAALILAEADGKLERRSTGSRVLHSKTIVLALFNNTMHLYSHFLMKNETIECGKKLVYMLKNNSITTVSTKTAESAVAAQTSKEFSRQRSGHQQHENQRNVFFQENSNEDHSIFILNALLVSRSVITRLAPAA
jgi:hypothetical protein